METGYPGIFAIGDTTTVTSPSGRSVPKAAVFAKNGAKAAAANVLRYLGKTDAGAALSGEGYCYLDTGGGASAQGKGDFFSLPHPAIHLTAPSVRDWRALWEGDAASLAG